MEGVGKRDLDGCPISARAVLAGVPLNHSLPFTQISAVSFPFHIGRLDW